MSSESHDYIHDTLLSIPKFGDGIGLHRMKWLMGRIPGHASPFNALKVTGSNGKGSVCAMLSAMLEQLHIPHGLYTSPHLFRFNERIRLGRAEIEDAALMEAIHWFQDQERRYAQEHPSDRFGAFEVFTAIALYAYAQRHINHLVAEAGIGGRYDATRLIPGDIVALTSLDLEHTHLLGHSLELIAYDKADLCPTGGTLVIGPLGDEIERRLAVYCEIKGMRMVPATSRCRVVSSRYEGMTMMMAIEIDGTTYQDIPHGLMGPHQARNTEVAMAACLEWIERYHPLALDHPAIVPTLCNSLQHVAWHGRCSKIHSDPDVYIDVGHSPRAVEAAMSGFRPAFSGKRVLLVTGVSHDKDAPGILRHLLPVANTIIATRAYHRGGDVDDIIRIIKNEAPNIPVSGAETMELAMSMALEKARAEGMVVLVAGGLFLSIEAEAVLMGEDPHALKFF